MLSVDEKTKDNHAFRGKFDWLFSKPYKVAGMELVRAFFSMGKINTE